jgi:hypothetical protein
MGQDLNIKIEKLKGMAIGRCRERIDQAACRAKELMNRSGSEEQPEQKITSIESYGMTSCLKKRHGL